MKAAVCGVLVLGVLTLGFAELLAARAPAAHEVDAESEPRAALGALNEYFAAIEAEACPRLLAVSSRLKSETECHEELEEFARHRASFVKVVRMVKDGRSQSAWLATTRLVKDGRSRDILLRVENQGQGWKVKG